MLKLIDIKQVNNQQKLVLQDMEYLSKKVVKVPAKLKAKVSEFRLGDDVIIKHDERYFLTEIRHK